MTRPIHHEVLEFWFGVPRGPRLKHWFEKDAVFDAEVRRRFLPLYEESVAGAHAQWLGEPETCLARIVVLDQLPRNMFRGAPRAFASDPLGLEAARHAVAARHDRDRLPVERLFFYLPFEHSENLADQDRSVALFKALGERDYLDYALRHHAVIRDFGRFPHRNACLGREPSSEELDYLAIPGSGF